MATTKAFDLKLLVGRENIMGNKPKVAIESMETSDKNLYIGTNDGTLYHFLLLEDAPQRNRSANNNLLSAFLQAQKRISTKKPIVQIKATTELKCLLINSDGGIFAYSMINLEPAFSIFGKMKNVSRFFINDHPVHANPFAVEMCVSYVKRKTVQIYQVQEDNVIPLKEISLPEHPHALALDGRHMCVGSNSGYMMVDLDTNSRQELLPPGENKLFVYKVAPAEFLLAAPNALGVFVTSAGISQRAPIQLSSSVSHACFVHPYVIAMDDEFLTVHSVVDQQQKQTLPFQGGNMLLQNAGKVLVCTGKDVFVLLPIPYDQQVSDLLGVGKVEQAMDLAKALRKSMPRDLYSDMMLMTYRKAGFVHFQQMEFDLAEDMFNKGRLDIREVISLYDGILPTDSNFVRSVNPYHTIASVQQWCSTDAARLSEYEEFLAAYMLAHPLPVSKGTTNENPFEGTTDTQPGYRLDLFLSAIAIFAKLHKTEEILALIQEKIPDTHTEPVGTPFFYEFKDSADDVSRILKNAKCDHARCIYLMLCGNMDAAMLIWKDLSTGQKIDVDFPGLRFVAKCLGRFCKDVSILWKHAEWMLELDQSIGITVFTDHFPVLDESPGHRQETENKNWPKPDDVISFLNRYPQALRMYLEYLVFVCRIPKEKHHTHLAVLYLERVLKLKEQKNQNESELDAARAKLQKLLKESSTYRISLILGKVKEAGMHPECVILYGKLSEHKKALAILVEEMSDQKAAEEYCMAQGANHEEKTQLFGHLLEIYLSDMVATHDKRTKAAMATVDLLNRYAEYYDVQRVLGSLPESWSTTLLSQFLSHSVRLKMHRLQTSYVQLMLERSENNNARKEQMGLHNTNVRLTEDKICEACNKLFRNTDCAFYPNRVPVHVQCGGNGHVCPVTGRLFKALPAPKYS